MRLGLLADTLRANEPIAISGLTTVASRWGVADVTHDSRQVKKGTLFGAVVGKNFDSHIFVEQAAAAGAPAAIVQRFVKVSLPQFRVSDPRRTLAAAASAVHGHPSQRVSVVGVTGTNGKTTTTHLLSAIMAQAGVEAVTMGTLDGVRTTPEACDFQRALAGHLQAGVELVAAEISSHALDQHRVDHVDFEVACFTNLTPEHLDFHRDMRSYFAAKVRLFDGRARFELINVDDPWGIKLARMNPRARCVTLDDVNVLASSAEGSTVRWKGQEFTLTLPGRFNVANAIMAAEIALCLGLDAAQVAEGLSASRAIPGRMQMVAPDFGNESGPRVFVDYSHTPDSLERALEALRPGLKGRLLLVFGCGGDRDRTKRPMMGRAAEIGADVVIVTSDNPRSEDQDAIIAEILAGLQRPQAAMIEPDRRLAIELAIGIAKGQDVVLIAGKGHEQTQVINGRSTKFDDVEVASSVLGHTLS